ncbi:MAG: REP-associated tyrosine transposase [Gaiellaceae bacterium]|nr:REP-associated tyrosine transposase [Gaiellaceae bacterium]
MGRPPRDYHPDGIYHLTSHGIDERPIFRDDVDRQRFCIRFRRVVLSERWDVHAACLMDTHIHLLIRPKLGRVSDGMKLLLGGHSRVFNERHGRRGALFESRYADREIRDEPHYQETVRYIEENPVAAGLVESARDWIWSTAAERSPLRVSDTPWHAGRVSDAGSTRPPLPQGV